jgi:hypothetical protein
MGLELEDEVCHVDEEKYDGGPTGDEEKTRSATLLDGTRLAGLHKGVEDIILDGLGHEISSRDDERFYGASKPN